jgi:hypothetical protein
MFSFPEFPIKGSAQDGEAENLLKDPAAILAYFQVILFGLRHSQEIISKLSGGLRNDT